MSHVPYNFVWGHFQYQMSSGEERVAILLPDPLPSNKQMMSNNDDRSQLRSNLKLSIEGVLAEVANDSQLRNGMARSGYQPPQAALPAVFSVTTPRNPVIATINPIEAFKPDLSGLLGSPSIGEFLIMRLSEQQRLLQQTRAALLKEQFHQHQIARQNQLLRQQLLMHSVKKIDLCGGNNSNNGQVALAKLLAAQLKGSHAASPVAPPAQASRPAPVSGTRALQALGSHLRKKDDPYIDAARLASIAVEDGEAFRKTRGGVSEPFPEKLHRMLTDTENDGLANIVSFFPHGRAFAVHNMDRFVKDIMPKYFKQTKWNSFARQLNLYGFVRITSGPDEGGYYHELFLKGRLSLVHHMRRVGVPQGEDRRKMKARNTCSDPDFYSMPALT